MKGEELSRALTMLDEELVEETARLRLERLEGRCRRKAGGRALLLAACLCLLLGVLTALASGGFGVRLLERFTGRTEPGSDLRESGYDLAAEVELIPAAELTGEVREVPGLIAEQFQTYPLWSSWYPGAWQRRFPTGADAREYLGLERLRALTWELEETETILTVTGDRQGKIGRVHLETDYRAGELFLQTFATAYTEDWEGAVTTGVRTTEAVTYTWSQRTTGSGETCLVGSSSPMESGYLSLEGYAAADGVLYHVNIPYQAEDAAQAEQVLDLWIEQF